MDRAHLLRLARAAHLPLGDAEADALAADLAVILRRLEPLGRVDVAAVPPAVAPDGAAPRPDATAPDALVRGPASFAPAFRDPWFVVPRLPSHAGETTADPVDGDTVERSAGGDAVDRPVDGDGALPGAADGVPPLSGDGGGHVAPRDGEGTR
jgi:aspartyl-tRNA(Asn)/glutamyl-tRNA(Gln) amidotransferase subunit C